MKSRTSFSKTALLRKDITRFAPVWGIYLLCLVMIFLSVVGVNKDEYSSHSTDTLAGSIWVFAPINAAYALICALLLFGDLFKSRMCNALHAMPPRRSTWFWIHMATGLLFSFVPNLVGALVLLPSILNRWTILMWWLIAVELQFVFFFGLAALCCMCVGNRLGALMIYGIVNFAAPIAAWMANNIYVPMLPTVVISTDSFGIFSPVLHLVSGIVLNQSDYFDRDFGTWMPGERISQLTYRPIGPLWQYMAVLAVIGALLALLALLIYRRRKLESAGDFLAIRALNPLFSLIFTVFTAALFAMFGSAMGKNYLPFLCIGVVTGFFIGQMLLRRTVKVFQGKTFLRFAVVSGVVALSLVSIRYDFFGIETWIPKASRVESVQVVMNGDEDQKTELTEPADIEEWLRIHDMLMDLEEPAGNTSSMSICLRYKMKNGTIVQRIYRVPRNGDITKPLKQLFSRTSVVLWSDNPQVLHDQVSGIKVGNRAVPRELCADLLDAIIMDCQTGNMAQFSNLYGSLHREITVEYRSEAGWYGKIVLNVWSSSDHVCQWIDAHWSELLGKG